MGFTRLIECNGNFFVHHAYGLIVPGHLTMLKHVKMVPAERV